MRERPRSAHRSTNAENERRSSISRNCQRSKRECEAKVSDDPEGLPKLSEVALQIQNQLLDCPITPLPSDSHEQSQHWISCAVAVDRELEQRHLPHRMVSDVKERQLFRLGFTKTAAQLLTVRACDRVGVALPYQIFDQRLNSLFEGAIAQRIENNIAILVAKAKEDRRTEQPHQCNDNDRQRSVASQVTGSTSFPGNQLHHL